MGGGGAAHIKWMAHSEVVPETLFMLEQVEDCFQTIFVTPQFASLAAMIDHFELQVVCNQSLETPITMQ